MSLNVVVVSPQHNAEMNFAVSFKTTVDELIREVAGELGRMNPRDIEVTFEGNELLRTKTVLSYGISDGDTLEVVESEDRLVKRMLNGLIPSPEALLKAVRSNDPMAEWILRSKLHPDKKPSTTVLYRVNYIRPLELAWVSRNLDMCRLLIKYGADNKNLCYHKAWSPEAIRFLKEAGVHPDTVKQDRQSALFCVGDVEKAASLIQVGANVNFEDAFRNTPLHYRGSCPEIAKLLLDNGAIVNHRNGMGRSPLFKCNFKRVCELLLRHGADVNLKDNIGMTALFTCQDGESAQLLIDNGANVNEIDNQGRTPLFYSNNDTVQVLLRNGASATHTDKEGNTPLFICKKSFVAETLINAGTSATHLNNSKANALFTVPTGEVAQVLLAHGASPNQVDDSFSTALFNAKNSGRRGVAIALMNATA
eukprot:TRINITY_DN4678_c0_g1_i1.p1 TRINITY_DN4678_c0_g1~~TRINITY_DN4678_c0_g1_i1.p1  ORF type:complete len:422 (+),score=46.49 TRINITY_DN4678_c0_g1_i1:40-1305(+)